MYPVSFQRPSAQPYQAYSPFRNTAHETLFGGIRRVTPAEIAQNDAALEAIIDDFLRIFSYPITTFASRKRDIKMFLTGYGYQEEPVFQNREDSALNHAVIVSIGDSDNRLYLVTRPAGKQCPIFGIQRLRDGAFIQVSTDTKLSGSKEMPLRQYSVWGSAGDGTNGRRISSSSQTVYNKAQALARILEDKGL